MDLDVVMKSNDCSYIVQFYGAIFKEGDCWIAMEIMSTSLDKFYKYVCERQMQRIPENILGQITVRMPAFNCALTSVVVVVFFAGGNGSRSQLLEGETKNYSQGCQTQQHSLA